MDQAPLPALLRALRARRACIAQAGRVAPTALPITAPGGAGWRARLPSRPLLLTSLVTLCMTACAALLVLAPPAAHAEALPPAALSAPAASPASQAAVAPAPSPLVSTAAGPAAAAAPADGPAAGLEQRVQALARQASQAAVRAAGRPGARVAIEVGQLDPRLRLAPCSEVQPYLPAGARLWGRTRIGLRCADGPRRWNVYLPITVKVFGQALTVAGALPAGAVITEADLRLAEVDLAAADGAALAEPAQALGRTLARPLAAGEALRSTDLKSRLWFAAGEPVRIRAAGAGYAVSGEGQALSPGLEGQRVRVRTETGRIVTGVAVAERQVEVAL